MIRQTFVLYRLRLRPAELMSFKIRSPVMFSLKKTHSQVGDNRQQLLGVTTPLHISTRTMGDASSPKISLENPAQDYKALINEMIDNEDLDDTKQKEIYNAIAEEARNIAWKLLFDEPVASAENQKKAGELLSEHKLDACFYCPWDYNEWIVGVRDELLKRKMHDFWHNYMVKESLGLCWARDCDYFDDTDDPRPADFYRHAGATPPWEKKESTQSQDAVGSSDNGLAGLPAQTTTTNQIPTNLKISLETPVEDYRKIVEQFLTENTSSNDDEIEETYRLISECARKAIWSLLFDDPQPPTTERQEKAGELLKEHKSDAAFYAPWAYNEWIVKLRDEVLKREILDFWRRQMVTHSLGPCWAKDSDYYDDVDDPEPALFYKHAGCVAPWLTEEAQNEENESKAQ